jgi:hypothetical protein
LYNVHYNYIVCFLPFILLPSSVFYLPKKRERIKRIEREKEREIVNS